MPELPEVETIKKSLKPHLLGHKVLKISAYIESVRYPLAPLKAQCLAGQKIIAVRRRARYLLIELANRHCFIIHLGMSGSLRMVPENTARLKHEHVIWHLDTGMTLRFNCPRRFGFVKACELPVAGAEPPELAHLGPEPLTEEFNADYLYRVSRKRNCPVKSLIMNNLIVVGVGNIYVTEALFASRISPLRKAMNLNKKQCALLTAAIKEVLRHSIEIGGTTIADYKDIDGSEGKFVQHLQVYGKTGAPCPVCGTPVKQQRIGGRSSCYCPACQK
ncbi:MAG: bifunctional DNA-formamidopyrimidine glycosylase/DNA-(apurinic or apyrimidinic site) lyase [Victivallales bacterium]|nr:bifunctional DNA-formamidopyrimidine glycosylase/DNA-(apurinic or apyrimidinic site) lyase [Victivallales bacterium]